MATFLLDIKRFYIFTWGGEPSEVIHNSCFYIKRVHFKISLKNLHNIFLREQIV